LSQKLGEPGPKTWGKVAPDFDSKFEGMKATDFFSPSLFLSSLAHDPSVFCVNVCNRLSRASAEFSGAAS